jgi:hypothetical protein
MMKGKTEATSEIRSRMRHLTRMPWRRLQAAHPSSTALSSFSHASILDRCHHIIYVDVPCRELCPRHELAVQ